MAKRIKSSSGDMKNPYQCANKVHRFWDLEINKSVYSQASRDYFNECANRFIVSEQNSKKVQWIKSEKTLTRVAK